MNELKVAAQTMTSLELFDILDNFAELKGLHQAIRRMFPDEISDGNKMFSSLDSRGYVEFYVLSELQAKMFVASKNIKYLEKITQYWIDKSSSEPKLPQTFSEALQLAAGLQKQLEVAQPAIEFHKSLFSENRKCSINEFAKLLSKQHEIVIGQNKLMEFLRVHKYLMSGRNKKEKNMPFQKYMTMGWFEVEYIKTHVGRIPQTMIMPEGQLELSDIIVNYFSDI